MPTTLRSWLTIWSWLIILFGAFLALAAVPGPDRLVWTMMRLFGPGAALEPHAALTFATALMGCVTLGWGLTVRAFVAATPLFGDNWRGPWRQLVTGALVWYLLDSAASIATGFWVNALSNTLVLVLLVVPLARGGLWTSAATRPAIA